MHEPTISAVIPARNAALTLPDALASALGQTEPPDEILVVDDASTDETAALAEQAAAAAGRVRVLRRKESGPGGYAARNFGIEQARGEWIAFLDADDTWQAGWMRTARRLVREARDDVGLVFASRLVVRPDGREHVQTALPHGAASAQTFDLDGFLALWLKLRRSPAWTSATLVRRDAAIAAGLFPAGRCRRGGDKDLWLRMMALESGVGVQYIAATYRLGVPGQVTQTAAVSAGHCLAPTVRRLAADAPAARARALRQVLNLELFRYGLRGLARGEVGAQWLDAMSASASPGLYAAARAVAMATPARRALGQVLARRWPSAPA